MISLDHIPIELRGRIQSDLDKRTKGSDYYFNLDNDWDLHLYALVLRCKGHTKEYIRKEFESFDMDEVPLKKKNSYIEDVLNSIIVGFEPEETALPVYMKVGGN